MEIESELKELNKLIVKFGVVITSTDIKNTSRISELIFKRAVYFLFLRIKGYTLIEIAKPIGKHHSTVIWSLSYAKRNQGRYPNYKEIYKKITGYKKYVVNKRYKIISCPCCRQRITINL